LARTKQIHTHPCQRRGQRTECDGTFTSNHDGWPAAVCDAFHRPDGLNPEFLCEDCRVNPRLHLDDIDQAAADTAPLA
jgi:hypothetical protein